MTLHIGGDGRRIKKAYIGTYSGYTEIKEAYLDGVLVFQNRVPFDEVTFNTVGIHTFVVPNGNDYVDVEVVGSQGGTGNDSGIVFQGGNGGKVTCRLKVTEGQTLYCYVGEYPGTNDSVKYNASDIRTSWDSVTGTSLNSRIVVAGGGGYGGTCWYYAGGTAGAPGGGLTGGTAGTAVGDLHITGGGGGSQTAGGVGGRNTGGQFVGAQGNFGLGGGGYFYEYLRGGHGGAGWYGGGGGSSGGSGFVPAASGGGGGSSYTHPTLCTSVAHAQGVQPGQGYIKIRQVASS